MQQINKLAWKFDEAIRGRVRRTLSTFMRYCDKRKFYVLEVNFENNASIEALTKGQSRAITKNYMLPLYGGLQ